MTKRTVVDKITTICINTTFFVFLKIVPRIIALGVLPIIIALSVHDKLSNKHDTK